MKNYKKEFIRWSHELSSEGLVVASSGNISVNIAGQIYIKKSATHFKNATQQDLININNKKLASVEWKLHKACYQARPDIKAVVHTHPVALLALASMNIKIKPVTIDFVIYFGNGIKQASFASPGSKKLAQITKKAIKKYDAVMLSNHGLVTVGESIKEAAIKAIIAEREAKIILASILLKRKIKTLTPAQIKSIYKA